jgi:hypothetical protein
MRMPPVECFRCRLQGRCSHEETLCRKAFFAMGKGKPAPECRQAEPHYWHGVEGCHG